MATWKQPKNDYKKEDQVVPEIFNTLAENERYLQETKITTEQVQDAEVNSTQATTRETLGDKETVKGFFGKIRKWFADLRALAFKGTVGTNDIDNSAVTSAKIGTGAVTTAKLGTSAVTAVKIAANAVETSKIKDSAVTDAKINSVSASKVTGLHKVATSGSYNDLTDKPNIGGGGLSLTKYEYRLRTNYPLKEGLFLCYVRWHNRGSIYGVSGCGLLSISKWAEAGCYSGVSAVYEGDSIKIQIECQVTDTTMSFSMYESKDGDGNYAPNDSGYFEGGAEVVLYKIGDTSAVSKESNTESGGDSTTKTWQLLTADNFQVQGDYTSNSVTVYVPGLKKGDEFKFTAMSVKVNEDPNSECYFYNSPDGNMVYGFTYDGYSSNDFGIMTGWHQLTSEYDYPTASELEFLSSAPYSGEVGVVDYNTTNRMTINVSCKQDNYLTVEWSDSAGMYIEMMPIYNIYVLK